LSQLTGKTAFSVATLLLLGRTAGVLLPIICLGACGGPPWTLSQSPSEISLRWYADDTPGAVAEAVAEQHCRSFGKTAELVSDDRDGSAEIAKYRCR